MKHSIHFINNLNNTAGIYNYIRQNNDNENNGYRPIALHTKFSDSDELSASDIKRQIRKTVQPLFKQHRGITRCYSVVIFKSKNMMIPSPKHLEQFHQHRGKLIQHTDFCIHRLLEHESIAGSPKSSLHMSQLVYLIVRYSAPGVTLSSLTKKEAASRLNLKSTQLNGLLTKLIKAELISFEPFSFIAPTEKFWKSGCPTALEKMFTYSPAESSLAKISEVQENALRFISDFNDLKVHNLTFSYERRMRALKELPYDIRVFFQPTLTSYVQDIKMKVLTIERGL